MIRDLSISAFLIGLVVAALYLAVERPAIEQELKLCTNGRITWQCQ